MSLSILRFESVSRTVGDLGERKRAILFDVSFDVAQGDVCGLVGHNGAGKSTVINLAMGFSFPTSGRILLCGGHPANALSRSQVGFSGEHSSFPSTSTAREVIELHSRLLGLQPDYGVLERVALRTTLSTRVGGFSKGMRQRLALAVALIGAPKFLVLDEPMSGLDPVGRSLIREVLLEERSRGTTILFSSHVLSDVVALCNTVVVLRNGQLVLSDTIASTAGGWVLNFEPGQDLTELVSATNATQSSPTSVDASTEVVWAVAAEASRRGLRIVSVTPEQRALERRLLPLLENSE